MYTSSGGSWSSGVALTPPAGSADFGTSVALSSNGTVALVGDPSGGGGTGSATVYTLTSGVWSSGVALTAPAEAERLRYLGGSLRGRNDRPGRRPRRWGPRYRRGDRVHLYDLVEQPPTDLVAPTMNSYEFGTSVALSNSGSIALVGDPLAGGDGDGAGTGWVTSFSGGSYGITAQIKVPEATTGGFGTSLAVSSAGTTAVVGDQTYPTGGSAGIYTASETDSAITSWAKASTLTPPSGSQAFGTAVAITAAGTEALVGDPDPRVARTPPARPAVTALLRARGPALLRPPRSRPPPSPRTSAPRSPCPLTRRAHSWVTRMAAAPTRSWTVPWPPTPRTGAGGTLAPRPTRRTTPTRWGPRSPCLRRAPRCSKAMRPAAATAVVRPPSIPTTARQWRARARSAPPTNTSSFGTSVAISGNGTTAVVGDPDSQDLTTGTGGTATVYTYNGSAWSAGTALAVPSSADAPAYEFGNSVAISASGNEILVGDPGGGVNGTGAVTEFTLSGTTWSAGTALPTPAITYDFGNTVALSANGDLALVADTGVPGGSVTPYTLSAGTFVEGNPLVAPAHASAFGTALALSQTGNVAIVGDPTGGSLGTGAATVYTDTTGSWVQNASLAPVGTAAQFGSSVALSASGATALVGDPTAQTYGTATVYAYSGTEWSAGTPLTVTPNAGNFGTAVALSANGTIAAVGDPDGGLSGGEVTVFSLDATTAATNLSASANPSSATDGSQIRYSATISGGSGTPTGTVTFSTGLLRCAQRASRAASRAAPRATPRPGRGRSSPPTPVTRTTPRRAPARRSPSLRPPPPPSRSSRPR